MEILNTFFSLTLVPCPRPIQVFPQRRLSNNNLWYHMPLPHTSLNGHVHAWTYTQVFVTPKIPIHTHARISLYQLPNTSGLTSLMFKKAIDSKTLQGIKLSRSGPTLFHLLFANDVLMFAKPNLRNTYKTSEILNAFTSALGLMINLDKSGVIFEKGTSRSTRSEMAGILHMQKGCSWQVFGHPNSMGPLKELHFEMD